MATSEPVYEFQVDHDQPVPMRDGAILRADVYRSAMEGHYPVIIERTQGGKGEGGSHNCPFQGQYFAPRGYVYVAQDVRGAYASEGEFYFGWNDGWGLNRDGYDTVEWAAQQPWSNGKVGMAGTCGSGMTEYQVAPTRPPHLKTLFVYIGGGHKNYFYRNNVYRLSQQRGMAFWFQLMQFGHETAPAGMGDVGDRLQAAFQNPDEMASWFRHLPLKSYPPAETLGDWFYEGLDHPDDGPFWWESDVSLKVSEIDLPIFHVGAWFDFALDVTLKLFAGIQRRGRTAECRQNQRLMVGPWGHLNLGERQVGGLDFGPAASLDLNLIRLQWYDHWLKGVPGDLRDQPAVRLFLMGENRWIDCQTWPPGGMNKRCLYLREGGGESDASLNNGRLTFEKPDQVERPDSYIYDPENPIPSLAGDIDAMPVDYRSLEGLMLTYTSDHLEEPLRVVGPVQAILYGLSTAPDTDWVVRLCDVWPDGRSISVCDGVLRARYRESSEREDLLLPNQVYCFVVDLWATAQTFLPGHRMRVQVTSSDFPRYDRNLNTGGPFGEEVQGQVAVNTIFHDQMRPSHLLIPVMELVI